MVSTFQVIVHVDPALAVAGVYGETAALVKVASASRISRTGETAERSIFARVRVWQTSGQRTSGR